MSRAAEYREFLKTPFWKALSLRVRNKFGFRCQRCGKPDHCQAHHRFYREDWNQTQEDDLECICRECHEKEHGINVTVRVSVTIPRPAPPVPVEAIPAGAEFWTRRMLNEARRDRLISKAVFKSLIRGAKKHKKLKRRRKKHKPNTEPLFKNSVRRFSTHRPRWVSRGGSSN